ncbi:MAG: RHS repeat protein [Nitrospira sp.]|nr:RHS repeat protein [Nitrospira sp.]
MLATPQSFAYDPVGNRTTNNSTVNAGNQLTADTTHAYQYDDNGNLTRKTLLATGNYTQYTYDAENRLVKVEDFVAGNPTPAFTSTIGTMAWAVGLRRSPTARRSGTSMTAKIFCWSMMGTTCCKPGTPTGRALTNRLRSRRVPARSSIIKMGWVP